MHSVRRRLRQLATAIQVLVLATSVGLPFLGQQAFAEDTVPLTGTVTGPGGEFLGENIWVYLTQPGEDDPIDSLSSGPNGVNLGHSWLRAGGYEIDVPTGTYDVHFAPVVSTMPWFSKVYRSVVIAGGPLPLMLSLCPPRRPIC